jgi:hypothetical protein
MGRCAEVGRLGKEFGGEAEQDDADFKGTEREDTGEEDVRRFG